jgi:hypothetical protein
VHSFLRPEKERRDGRLNQCFTFPVRKVILIKDKIKEMAGWNRVLHNPRRWKVIIFAGFGSERERKESGDELGGADIGTGFGRSLKKSKEAGRPTNLAQAGNAVQNLVGWKRSEAFGGYNFVGPMKICVIVSLAVRQNAEFNVGKGDPRAKPKDAARDSSLTCHSPVIFLSMV